MASNTLPRTLRKALRKALPKSVEEYFAGKFRWNLESELNVRSYRDGFMPIDPRSDTYLIPRTPEPSQYHESSPLPIPPKDLWWGYGNTIEEYVVPAMRDVRDMWKILGEGDEWLRAAGRILDFGCGSGRMIRWLSDVADSCEIWGTDISSRHIYWCKQNLSPPFHFATTTTYPHLPFEDRWFGLIYAGSVFTHIDDLADAWFLELRRILRPGGRLYVTLHDRNSIEFLEKLGRDDSLAKRYLEMPKYEEYIATDFAMFSLHRSIYSNVFYDIDYLCRSLEPIFRTVSVTPGAYYHQTALLLERV